MLDPNKKDTPCPRAKEKPLQDGTRGKISFRIKPHTRHKCSKDSNKTLCTPGPRDLTETEPDLPLSVWVSPAEAQVSSGLPWEQGLWLQQTREAQRVNPTEWPGRQPTNWRTIIPKKFPHCCESTRVHNRFPNLGIQQRDWESPENLTLKASRIWLQNFHRTGETDSWRAQTKPCAHQDPGERSSGPTRDWARLLCECPGVSSRGVGQQWPAVWSGAWNTTVLAKALLKEVTITPTIVWPQAKLQEGNTAPPSKDNWIKDLLSMAPPQERQCQRMLKLLHNCTNLTC